MKIIVSPTKQMKLSNIQGKEAPYFVEESKKICEALKDLSIRELCSLMKIKESIALENQERYKQLTFTANGSAALYTYQGLQFKHMKIDEFDETNLAYVKEHLRIVSALYGIVRPMDSIQAYRLEMQSRLPIGNTKDMYQFWGNHLAERLRQEEEEKCFIVNLASKEYAKAILPFLQEDEVVTITFYVEKEGKLKSESTQVKMARGLFVHWMVKHQITKKEQLMSFCEDGYQYVESLSNTQELVFVKQK